MTVLPITAACLLDTEGRIVTVRKRGTAKFMLPGGKIESGESASDGVLREIREEIGLVVRQCDLRPLGRYSVAAANEADTWIDARIFVGALHRAVRPEAEIDEVRMLDPGAPLPTDLAPLLTQHVLPALRRGL
ncbi:NUDIX hydrolase [Spelaeicoccus albus]|uniref:8-oxo-dGTP pyrophosphatase MutT (NUDIX family) n=1 Tax=Spelaeicoccus albus TaxID=1280376 RepID=A0A7Z0AAH0_9MICO|nr:NUDIX domain-containing protein [Spelaeicoccus albus]NYI66320.1 8-oxo-dGTP pyrophosphatase MutT (NUDIX family) [Spelaeicoccus albus]